MTLDADDQANLAGVRYIYRAPKVADMIVAIDAQYGKQPEMKAVNATFGDLAKNNTGQLKKLNTVLENNPGLAAKIQANLGKDPEAFRKTFLPAIFQNPDDAVKLTEQQSKQQPQSAPPQQPQQKAAPFTKTYDFHTEPLAVVAPVAAGAPAAAGAVPKQTAAERIAAKMDKLAASPGYDDLMDHVQKNQKLSDAFKAMMASAGTDADKEEFVDSALAEVKKDPNVLKKMAQGLDSMPGAADTAADIIAGDPKNGVKNVVKKMNEMNDLGLGGEGGMGSFFGKLFGPGGFGAMGGGAGGFMAVLQNIMQTIVNLISGAFASGNHLVAASNTGTAQYDEARKATNAKPDSVTVVDQTTGQLTTAGNTSTGAATPEKPKAPAAAGPQQGQPA